MSARALQSSQVRPGPGAGFPRWALCVSAMVCLAALAPAAPGGGPRQTGPSLNVYKAVPGLPWDLQRVALLPLFAGRVSIEPESRIQLEQALHAECIRSGFAEIIPVPPDTLRRLTGRGVWAADEPLPPDFLARLRAETAADAVLFAEVTAFRPYRPALLGWRLRLVDTRSATTWWAADQLFDATDPRHVRAASQWEGIGQPWWQRRPDGWRTLQAPRELARMTSASLLATLPARDTRR